MRLGLESATIEKHMRLISVMCSLVGNRVFFDLKAEGETFPKRTPKNLESLTQEQVEIAITKAGDMGGWYGEVAQFILAVFAYTGMRPSELRLAHFEDLDIRNWRIRVRHPKGEGSYGRKRLVVILPPARPRVLRFVEARSQRLEKLGIAQAEPLVPSLGGTKLGFYSGTGLRSIKTKVEEAIRNDPLIVPFSFSLKKLRDTFCQMNIDMNPSNLSAVSVQMGHSTTETTEKHYGRLKEKMPLEMLESEWNKQGAKNSLIEANFEVSG